MSLELYTIHQLLDALKSKVKLAFPNIVGYELIKENFAKTYVFYAQLKVCLLYIRVICMEIAWS